MAHFETPKVVHNDDGWGPGPLPEEYLMRPYQNFSKMERLGKIADWAAATTAPGQQTGGQGGQYADKRNQGRQGQDRQQVDRGGAIGPGSGTMAGISLRDEDDGGYTLVDSIRMPKPGFFRGGRGNRFIAQPGSRGGRGVRVPANQYRQRGRRGGAGGPGGFYPGQAGRTWDRRAPMKHRAASVAVKSDWAVLEDLDFPRLNKLFFNNVSEPEDLYEAGYLEFYDRTYDRVNSMVPAKLTRTDRQFPPLPITTEDPIIRKLAKDGAGNVFATDSVIATLMCSLRSVYSWDIVVSRFGNKLFLERREDSDLDTLLTVNETAFETPVDDGNEANPNSPRNLSFEAQYINQQFSQQVLDKKQTKLNFKAPNPFIKPGEDASQFAPAAYRYRRFQLGAGVDLVVRCELNAALHPVSLAGESEPSGPQLAQVYALNEVDLGLPGHVDWKSKIDTQRGSILATEIHNNSFKIAKWAVRSMLAGANYVKFGYVTRKDPNSNAQHTILGVQQFRPGDLLAQINMNLDNCWGVLRGIIDFCFKQKPGKYLIMKDPNKPVIRIYDCPTDAFEKEDDSDDEDSDEEEDDDDVAETPVVKSVVVDGQEIVGGIRVLDPDEEPGN